MADAQRSAHRRGGQFGDHVGAGRARDAERRPVGYVRADGADLPFADGTFDAVSCYGALYLMDDPFGSLRELVRVLKPGGRIAVLTTCARGPAQLRRLSVADRQCPQG